MLIVIQCKLCERQASLTIMVRHLKCATLYAYTIAAMDSDYNAYPCMEPIIIAQNESNSDIFRPQKQGFNIAIAY